jgi:hypothetical protein
LYIRSYPFSYHFSAIDDCSSCFTVTCHPVSGGTKEYSGGIFRVRQLYQRQVNRVMDIVVDGVTITCTPEHPFWVEGYGWVLAKDLEPGYWLLTKDGLNLPIDSVTWREGEETVYNFEMDEYHTYYVSQLAILSHNVCSDPDDLKLKNNLFRGDKRYKSGNPMGNPIGSNIWENVPVKTPWDHVAQKIKAYSGDISRFTSFTERTDKTKIFVDTAIFSLMRYSSNSERTSFVDG